MLSHERSLEWIASMTGHVAPISLTQMKGSTSSSVYLVQQGERPTSQRFVLRVLDNRAWLAEEPDLAQHEAAALNYANMVGLPAPRLIGYTNEDVGFGAPVVLMSFLEGSIDLQPTNFDRWIDKLAAQLAAIHHHTAAHFAWKYVSWANKTALQVPAWSGVPAIWEQAIQLALQPEPNAPSVFIHRDYHPTNVLWQHGGISGVVDWINACEGPAGVDVAHCRTNLMLMYGPTAAEQFLYAYMRHAPSFEYHPYWDIDSVIDMCYGTPGFYPPWQEFGLATIEPALLCARADNYVAQVIRSM